MRNKSVLTTIFLSVLMSSLNAQTNYSLNFENDSYVSVPHSADLNIGVNDPMSLSFWIIKSSSAEMHVLGKRAAQNGNCSFQIGSSGNNIGIGSSNNWDILPMTSSTITEKWTHVVFTFDGDIMKGYLNGTIVDSASGITLGPKSTVPLEIGTLQWGTSQDLFHGFIDEVGIWNEAINAAEVTALYNSHGELNAASNSGNYTSSSNLQGYWRFNEGTGGSVADASNNSNDGTINNTPQWSTNAPELNAAISSVSISADNSTMSVTFNEPVYNTSGGSGALEVGDFAFSISGGLATLSSATPTSISASGNVYTLGIGLSGTATGGETLTVAPVANSIYDASGNVASTSQSNNTITLNDKKTLISVKKDGTGDLTTISTAITNSSSGDTILVYAGTYTENIDYGGKNIVVGSLYMTTNDTSYISSTIIDGNQSGSVVKIGPGTIQGFTITNGSSTNGGGIINDQNSSATLKNLIVTNNTASGYGGGIYVSGNSSEILSCIV